MEDKDIAINLKISQWNVVLSALANGRFIEVSSIINEINKQAEYQINKENQKNEITDLPYM